MAAQKKVFHDKHAGGPTINFISQSVVAFLIRRHANDSYPGTSQAEPRVQKHVNTTKQPNDGTKQSDDGAK